MGNVFVFYFITIFFLYLILYVERNSGKVHKKLIKMVFYLVVAAAETEPKKLITIIIIIL